MTFPHDSLFKSVFGQPEHASLELRSVLPVEIARRVDWTSLRLESASLPGTGLEGRQADLLFSIRLAGRPAFLCLLLEHKSAPDRFTVVQVLGYVVRIWERFLQENEGATLLPVVLPIVVYHHQERWRYGTELLPLLDLDSELGRQVAPFVPSFRFLLDEVTAMSEAELRARPLSPLGLLAFLCFRRIRGSRRALREVVGLGAEMLRACQAHGMAALAPIFAYIMGVTDIDHGELARFAARELGPESEATLKTTADKLREEGRVEGRVEGGSELLLKLLSTRFGPLPPKAVARVRQASIEELERWAERVLTANTLDEVLRQG